jgi:hypothetical protein
MHYRRITELAVAEGLIAPRGLTPSASVNAAITTDIARRLATGEEEHYVAYGRGLYGLAGHKVGTEIEDAIRRNNLEVRERLLTELRDMHPRSFEDLIGRLLTTLGFIEVQVTSYSGDGGIDVRGTLAVGGITNVKTAIQVKRWANKVSGRTVRELRGGLSPHERGLIITTSGFTKDAKVEAETGDRTPISLINGDRLVGLLVEHGIGVVLTEARILRLDPGALLAGEEEELVSPESLDADRPDALDQPTTASGVLRVSRRATGKNLSLWPLPGGRGHYIETLLAMLTLVSDSEPTLDEFIGWMIDQYERVNSRKAAKGYIEVLRLAGLAESRGDRLVLTADAASYLASVDREELYLIMTRHIAGLEETLQRLRQSPASVQELSRHLNQVLGTDWNTDAQANWRVLWLECFGKVSRQGDQYVARPAGK